MKTEIALKKWMEDCHKKKLRLNGASIKHKALAIYKRIAEKELNTSENINKNNFSASNSWLSGFLQRNSLSGSKTKNEITSAVKAFQSQLAKIVIDGKYTPDQVWNVGETCLFWKKIPKTYGTDKDYVTLLFCSNASGDYMLKPFLINGSLKPKSMKNADKLPVHWVVNQKSYATTDIFTIWFNEYFIPEVKHYMKTKNLEFKVLLILNKGPVLEHTNVQFCFLPPKISSLIQPQDQGIIATFKSKYIKKLYQYILNQMERNKDLGVTDILRKFTINDCVKNTKLVLSEIGKPTLNACWKTIWPECVRNGDPIPLHINEYADIVILAHKIVGEDLSSADLDELIADKPIEDDEIEEVFPSDAEKENEVKKVVSASSDLVVEVDNEAEKIVSAPFDLLEEVDINEIVEDVALDLLEEHNVIEKVVSGPPDLMEENNEIENVVSSPSDLLEENHGDKNKESIFPPNLLMEGLLLANQLENHFLFNDPVVERATQFKRELTSCMALYQELYNEVCETATQCLTTEKNGTFLPKNSVNFSKDIQLDCNVNESMSSDNSDFLISCKRRRFESDSK